MRVKLFYLVEVVRRTDAQAATSLKNLGNDFPLPGANADFDRLTFDFFSRVVGRADF